MDNDHLSTYLDNMGSNKPLTDNEEAQLAKRIQQGDSRALDSLLRHNIAFVASIAKQYKSHGLDTDDIISEGSMGMTKAAQRYDGSKRFATFAAPYIRDAISKAIAQHTGLYRVPSNSPNPPLDRRRAKALSIDAPIGGSQELSLGRVIADKAAPNPETALLDDISRQQLAALTATLPERDRKVIERVYGIGRHAITMAETAAEMGLKRERVRQIRDHAIRLMTKARHK